MQPGQLVGPVEVPDGISIMLMIDRRQVLTADPRDAVLSLKQISLDFPAGTTQAKASELAGTFAEATRDRKSDVEGKSVSVRVDLGGSRIIKNKIAHTSIPQQHEE